MASLRISARFLSVILFALLFVHLHLATFDAEMLLVVILACFLVRSLLSRFSVQATNRGGEARDEGGGKGGRRKVIGAGLGKVVIGLVLLAVSPVLRTLTESTTSDSIWALSALLFFLHLALADYSGHKEGKKLTDTLSFNAAISASVVLASRLGSNQDTFTLLILAVLLFAPSSSSSSIRLSVNVATSTNSDKKQKFTHETMRDLVRFATLYTLTMTVGVGFKFVLEASREEKEEAEKGEMGWIWMALAYTNVVVTFVSMVCPWWIRMAQVWKMEISGPWDPAEPILSTFPLSHYSSHS
ncbi:uncharacterized protein MEPE_05814 [Melanopsichium pennsylvanicum]|uniref:Uncharacterized protein n=2 Tax=Melanopsichium pennsylvanicum TaxID=63383 RepID=A0AAJ5C838_9BASI|nr:uncharacterized protein MEPE_05814 [Melanopsichium pennsylvanicum]